MQTYKMEHSYMEEEEKNGEDMYVPTVFRPCQRCSAGCMSKKAKGDNRSHVPSFCTFFKSDFRSLLSLPKEFVATFKDQLKEDLILEGPSGQMWPVSADSEMKLVIGWETFVSNHSLQDGELLVFNMLHPSYFKVHIYGIEGGERHARFRIDVNQMNT